MSKVKWVGPDESEMISKPHTVWLVSMDAEVTEDKITFEASVMTQFWYDGDLFWISPLQDSDNWQAHEPKEFETYAEARCALDGDYDGETID